MLLPNYSICKDKCDKGFAYGPFLEAPFDTYHVSPIGVATGKYSDKKRLIMDLSAPHNDLKHCFSYVDNEM